MINQTDGNAYLAYVSEKIKNRLLALKETLLHGQQEIHDMHDYYWENYTEMDEYGYENYDNQQALPLITAVGPFVSADFSGEIPSETGMCALRPLAVAPITSPK